MITKKTTLLKLGGLVMSVIVSLSMIASNYSIAFGAPALGTTVTDNGYTYKYGQEYVNSTKWIDIADEGWGVVYTGEPTTNPGPILSEIQGYPVVSISRLYSNNKGIIIAPEIPNTVRRANYTFNGCKELTTVTNIPQSLYIARGMFTGCTSLVATPTLPDSFPGDEEIFKDCTSIKTVTNFPSEMTMGNAMFKGCTSLVNVPDLPSKISSANEMFMDCTALVKAPGLGGLRVARSTFKNCTALKELSDYSNIISFSDTFSGCTSLAGELKISSPILTYMVGAFSGCTGLTSVTLDIPNLNKFKSAFSECKNLQTLDLGSINAELEAEEAFKGCTGLTNANIGGIKFKTSTSMFEGCTSLANVKGTYSSGSTIRMYAGCTGLVDVPYTPKCDWTRDMYLGAKFSGNYIDPDRYIDNKIFAGFTFKNAVVAGLGSDPSFTIENVLYTTKPRYNNYDEYLSTVNLPPVRINARINNDSEASIVTNVDNIIWGAEYTVPLIQGSIDALLNEDGLALAKSIMEGVDDGVTANKNCTVTARKGGIGTSGVYPQVRVIEPSDASFSYNVNGSTIEVKVTPLTQWDTSIGHYQAQVGSWGFWSSTTDIERRIGDYVTFIPKYYGPNKIKNIMNTYSTISPTLKDSIDNLNNANMIESYGSNDGVWHKPMYDSIKNINISSNNNTDILNKINCFTKAETVNITGTGSLNIPDDFMSNMNLAITIIEPTVHSLGERSFKNTYLTDIKLEEGLEVIPPECFYNCSRLKGLRIPSTVESIGSNALKDIGYAVEVYSGTYAEQYCKMNSIPYKSVGAPPAPVVAVEFINASDLCIITGKTGQIQFNVLPAEATDKNVRFEVTNNTIATVSNTGIVHGIAVGDTTIKLTSIQNSDISTTINVTVTADSSTNPPSSNIEMNLSANTTPTNDVVAIEVEATGTGIKGIILPNGNFVNTDSFSYNVSNNGSYTFVVLTTDNKRVSKSISINCIDKIKPVMTLNSTITADKTTYSIKAIDKNSGIKGITLPDNSIVNTDTAEFTQTEEGMVSFISEDNAGNIATTSSERKVITITNGTSPTFIAFEGIPKEWTNKDAELKIMAVNETDPLYIQTSSVGRKARSVPVPTLSTTETRLVGSNSTVEVAVFNELGGSYEFPLVVDKIDKGAPTATSNFDGSVITVTAEDELSGINQVIAPDGTLSSTYTPTYNGTYRFIISDVAGNEITHDIKVTGLATPDVPIIPPSNNVDTDKADITIEGTVYPEGSGGVNPPDGTIMVTIPTKMAFIIDGDRNFISGDYIFDNKGTTNLSIKIKDVVATNGTTTQLVAPDKHANWIILDQETTKNEMALLINGVSLHQKDTLLFDLLSTEKKNTRLTGRYGHNWGNASNLMLNYTMSLELTVK